MDEQELEAILNDPKKAFNLLRVLHQLLHLYDKKEMEEQIKIEVERNRNSASPTAGLGDSVNVVVRDSNGNIKQEISK